MASNVIDISAYQHLRKTTRFQVQTKASVERKIYEIMIRASGLPDFHEKREYYIWYATQYCFAKDCELRDIEVEKKLIDSNPYLQLPM
ncbi:hypothetical protein OTK49_00715 [Vibrio coralliirubri]|uniref:hypothetical protein n=1 Tax=Vibrio coralliirubri TaxID=1516159 RepID=UPI002283B81E|nr:hypothetical protein [Vibrio coralliirubri]MCY9861056.1 hypothetical protein [Vibrio coralliirubri]